MQDLWATLAACSAAGVIALLFSWRDI